jgi:hypothetical protein
MKLLNNESLGDTINRIYHAELFGQNISSKDKKELTEWMLDRAGQKGSYSGLSAPTLSDFKQGATLFTGEKLTTGASTAHILGEDALSIMHRWNITDTSLQSAFSKLEFQWREKMNENEKLQGSPMGMFCCGKCSLAYWRGLIAGTMEKGEERLSKGLEILHSLRDGKGRWRRFPYYNTLWVLGQLPIPSAKKELQYAKAGMESFLKRSLSSQDPVDLRKRKILEALL